MGYTNLFLEAISLSFQVADLHLFMLSQVFLAVSARSTRMDGRVCMYLHVNVSSHVYEYMYAYVHVLCIQCIQGTRV